MKPNQIKEAYSRLTVQVKTDVFYTDIKLNNRVNCYLCKSCRHVTKTRDIDPGVTPYIIECEDCGKDAYSTFYKDIVPDQSPTKEWFRPTMEQTLQMSEGMIDHILQGGLDLRDIKKEESHVNA